MPSIMVYTEETFYYTDGIRVVAREEYCLLYTSDAADD